MRGRKKTERIESTQSSYVMVSAGCIIHHAPAYSLTRELTMHVPDCL